MSHTDQARELLASLRDVSSGQEDAEVQGEREEAHVRHLEEYLREHRARRQWHGLGWRRAGVGLAAAALLFGLGAAAKQFLFDAPPPPAETPEAHESPVMPSPPRGASERPASHVTRADHDEPEGASRGHQARPARPGRPAKPLKPMAGPDEAESTLAEQNALFTAAVKARRNGDPRQALGLLEQLLSRYSRSPLAEQAKVEQARARRYLANP